MSDIKDKSYFLKIQGERIYYSEKHWINVSATNIPSETTFSERRFVLIEIKIKAFDKNTNTIRAKIIDYNSKNEKLFSNQKPKGLLRRIEFESIEYKPLEDYMTSYKQNEFDDYEISMPNEQKTNFHTPLKLKKIPLKRIEVIKSKQVEFDTKETNFHTPLKVKKIPLKRVEVIKTKEVEFDIKETIFFDGGIKIIFNNLIWMGFSQPQEIKIYNKNIKETYSNLIPFIIKVLNKKKFKVFCEVKYIDNDFAEVVSAKSPDIDTINEKIIEEIKVRTLKYRLKKIKNEKSSHSKKIQIIENLLPEDPSFLAKYFKEIESKNHSNEIYYLASKTTENFSIRFMYTPVLSYLFLLRSKFQIFFVLETIDLNFATYIWSYKSSELLNPMSTEMINQSLGDLENELIKLIDYGRQKYKSNLSPTHFISIEHFNSDNGFNVWKGEIEKLLSIK